MPESITELLARVSDGNRSAVGALWTRVYEELRVLALSLLAREPRGQTLQATALVHEAYLKLVDQRSARLNDRAHFLAVAARAMRRILVDHARNRQCAKRDGGHRVSLESQLVIASEQDGDLLALDEAMTRLESINPTAARVIELRYFGALTIEEAATALNLSDSTIERQWRYARAWLFRALSGQTDANGLHEPQS
jgi:RNA polymerase sigma factor (TIGR02999 family)